MSYSLPSLMPKEDLVSEPTFKVGPYGVPDVLVDGRRTVMSDIVQSHPLEIAEKKYLENQRSFDFAMMRHVQGLHAPLRMVMERQAVSKVKRLPFLPSSNILLDSLMGKDDTIDFEDIFDNAEFQPMVTPHVVMEKSLGFI